ncbi:ribbon-helix-helix domain-containing protein [Candidatus Woesearchaeota archaeon]|nr:ribbon-helix-helix domain-containing protein [Candidatus Woesearchaeota archaeon]MCF7901550.1 ribbon-helix-helix domain-containing protein [Candidatus Woesearchaeota archaeon]
MKDATISIRLPTVLLNDLKNIATENYYVDLSEQIRAIIREKNKEYLQTKPSKTNIETTQNSTSQSEIEKQKLIHELQIIIEKLNKEL